MPKLNGRGDVIMGAGGIQGSLNGRPYPFSTYGRGCWLDDGQILVALIRERGAAYSWRPFSDPAGLELELVDLRPFNLIAGGGGKWAALMLPAAPAPPLQFGTLGDQPGAGAADVALDGSIVYKTAYHANAGLTFVEPAGGRSSEPGAFPVDYQALPGGRAIWRGGAHGRAPIRPALADAAFAKLATLEGEDWIVYWSESTKALVVQPDGGADGFRFQSEQMFDPDLIAAGDVLLLASSRTQGEGPGDLTLIEISRAGVVYRRGTGPSPAWGPLASAPPIEPPIEPPIDPPVEPPIKPPIKPPIDPPPPANPYRTHTKGSAMIEIDGKTIALRGAGGKRIAPDAPGTGIWGTLDGKPSQWRGVLYVADGAPAARYKVKKLPNGKYTYTNVELDCLAGADGGQYSTGLDKQGYHKPTGNTDAGALEQWEVYGGNANGALETQIEQVTDQHHPAGAGKQFFVFPLTVEILS